MKKLYEKKWVLILSSVMIACGGYVFNPQCATNFFSGFLTSMFFLIGVGLAAVWIYQKFVDKYTPESVMTIWLVYCLLSAILGFLISLCFYF